MGLSQGECGAEATEQQLRAAALEHEAAGRAEEAAADWGRLAARLATSARAPALARQARLLAEELARPDEALLLYRRALLDDPQERSALAALSERAARAGDWLQLVLLQGRRFAVETSGPKRAELARSIAQTERRHLHNPDAARRWLERGLEVAPSDASLHEALADLERERGDDATLLARLEHLIRLRAEHVSPGVLLEAASLLAERGEEVRALRHLQRAAAQAPEDALILDALVDVLERLGRYGDLADVHERRAELASDDPATRAAVLTELGALCESRLFDFEAALDAYERARAADPGAEVGAALERLRSKREHPAESAEAERSDAALRAYEREAEVTSDRERLGALVREIERLHTRRGTPDQALPWVQRWVQVAPEEPDALRALARLHDRPEQAPQLAATLEALDRLLAPPEQVANRRRLAEVLLRCGRLEEAEQAYARALAVAPDDRAALEGRVRVQRELGRPEALAAALQRLADLEDPGERTALLRELAEVQQQGDDLDGAIATLLRLEGEDPDEAVSERIDALLARDQRFEELEVRLRERGARHDEGSAEAVAALLRRAQLLQGPLGRHQEAAAAFRQVLTHAPESAEARRGLERALRSSIDAEALAAFLAEQEERAEDPSEREGFTFERAVLLEELLEQPDEALALFRALAEDASLAPLRRDAALRAERLLEREGDWPALRDQLTHRLGASPEEDARLHERLARLCGERLGDSAGELAHLEQVVELAPQRADVWQILAERYELEGRLPEAARALEAELATRPDAQRELALRGRLAELYLGPLGDAPRARPHYERVFEIDPSHEAAAHYLTLAGERDGDFEAVVRLLEARLAAVAEDDAHREPHALSRRTALRLQIAHVREARLADLEGAISALEVALGEVGPDALVAEPLAAAYQRAGYHTDLIELCRAAAAASRERAERANWLIRLGDTHLSREERRAAAAAYRKALTERPDDRAVQASLRELYRELGETEPLVALLEAELAHLAGTAEIPVRLELVELLGDTRPADALLHARRVLDLEPRHGPAFEAALDLALRLERGDDALAIVEARLQAARSKSDRAEAHLRRAHLLAAPLARPDEAVESYRAAFAEDPECRGARAALAELLERQERWSELLAVWEEQLGELPLPERATRIERAVTLAWERVSVEAALPWLARLRRQRPDDPEVWSRLAQAHRARGDDEAVLQALAAEAEATPDAERARRCHRERAAILRERGALGRALAALEAAGTDLDTLQEREALQRQLGLHAERATTLEEIVALRGPDLALHREIAELAAAELADPDLAIHHGEAALALAPPGSAARIDLLRFLAAMERRVGRSDRWARYAEQELAALDPTPVFDDRRRELRCELALAYDTALSRPEAALIHLRALLDADDSRLLAAEIHHQLERTCLRLLRAEGNAGELEQRLARYLERHEGRAEDWVELGQLREEALRASSAALEAYRRALELDPACLEAVRGLRRTAHRLGRWAEVADALDRESRHPSVREPAARGALLRALGDLHWHRLQSTTRASRCYAAALEANGSDFAALRALERLLEAMEDWRGALDLYESEVAVLGDANPRRRREIWLRVAELAREHSEEPERARRALRLAAEIEPLATPHRYTLAALDEALGDTEALAEDLGAWCSAPDAAVTAAELLRLSGALDRLGRGDEALEAAERAVVCEPESAAAWEGVARLRLARGERAAGAEALRCAAERSDPVRAASALEEASAHLAPEDPAGALALLRTAAERDPSAAPVQAARARHAAALGHVEEAEEAARCALELAPAGGLSDAELAEIARLGGDAARRRSRLEAAAGFYTEALRLAPEDAAVLGPHAEVLAALGDCAAARCALEARLDRGDPYPERPAHRALLGACLEAEDELDEALACYESALAEEPRQPEALEGAARVLEQLEQPDAGIAATLRWAAAAADGSARAERLLRAARWELRTGEREASAERHLREALAADSALAPAWTSLIELLLDQGRLDEAIACADRAAAPLLHDAQALAALAQLQGQAHEQRGERREAAEAFGIAAECDPSRAEAALAQARLLRGFGEWHRAADALARLAERYPGDDTGALAEVEEQLGRLRAGPLEDVEGAIRSYRRAIELAPARLPTRAALAELLSHRPADWDEALAHHRTVLAAQPTHVGCLRVALRIARGRSGAALVETGAAILRALGAASAREQRAEGDAAALVTAEPRLADPDFETLRRLARAASREIASTLGVSDTAPSAEPASQPEARFRARVLELQGALSAPALLALSPREVGEVLQLLVELVLEPDQVRGDGRRVNALADALGRRRRRKLRRLLGGAGVERYASIDFEAWHAELRALAAAEVIRADGAPLRTALCALARESGLGPETELGPETSLVPFVERDPASRALLRRVALDWLARL